MKDKMNKELKNTEKFANFVQQTYRRKNSKERMVDVIQQKFPNYPISVIRLMIWSIDAYVNNKEK